MGNEELFAEYCNQVATWAADNADYNDHYDGHSDGPGTNDHTDNHDDYEELL